jgi:hypothetical protein
MSGPLFVVADNYQLACHYAREHDLGRERRDTWRYISRPEQVFGRRGGRYVVVTLYSLTWQQWEERREILDTLHRNGFTREDP